MSSDLRLAGGREEPTKRLPGQEKLSEILKEFLPAEIRAKESESVRCQKAAAPKSNEFTRAKNKAFHLLKFRDRSYHELFVRLKEKFPEETCVQVCEHLKVLGFLDDEKFAKEFAQSLVRSKMASCRGVRGELLQKGVNRDIVEDVMGNLQCDDKVQIRALLQRKYRAFREDEKVRQRAQNFLLRRGFSWGDVRAAMRDV